MKNSFQILQAKAQANNKTAKMYADFILKHRHYAQSLMNDMNCIDGILFIKNRKPIKWNYVFSTFVHFLLSVYFHSFIFVFLSSIGVY